MKPPRNISVALAAVRDTLAHAPEPIVTLRATSARARLLSGDGLAGFSPAELRELIELALAPGATVPEGAAGEAVIAYLVADRAGQSPTAYAIRALLSLGSDDDASRRAVAGWLRQASERAIRQAIALKAWADGREAEGAAQ